MFIVMFNYVKPKLHWKHFNDIAKYTFKWKVYIGFQVMIKREFSFKVKSLWGPELKGDFNELEEYALAIGMKVWIHDSRYP